MKTFYHNNNQRLTTAKDVFFALSATQKRGESENLDMWTEKLNGYLLGLHMLEQIQILYFHIKGRDSSVDIATAYRA
jgi:hypothetical protein